MLTIATWTNGFFTLGLMAVAYGLACLLAGVAAGVVRGVRYWRRPKAPAVWLGWQEGLPATAKHVGVPGFECWNLTAPVGRHPVGSTVTRRTLEQHGYRVPRAPKTLTGRSSNRAAPEGSGATG